MRYLMFCVFFLSTILYGCGAATSNYERLSPSYSLDNLSQKSPDSVVLIREDDRPMYPIIRIATIGVHGNGFADKALLEKKLVEQAAKLGADFVMITSSQITKDEAIGIYRSGMLVSNQIQRMHLYGVAGLWSKVIIGINFDENAYITYVKMGSPAELSGLKEGYKILAIDGTFFEYKSLILDQIFVGKTPGDTIEIEYLDNERVKHKVDLVLASSKYENNPNANE